MINGNRERQSWAGENAQPQPPLKQTQFYSIDTVNAEQLTCYKGILYVGCGGTPNTIKAIDATSEQELWSFGIPNTSVSNSHAPAVNEELVFFGGQHGDEAVIAALEYLLEAPVCGGEVG